MWNLRFVLAALVLVCSSPSANAQDTPAPEGKLFGPYWTTLAGAETTLTINNPLADRTEVWLDLYSRNGELANSHKMNLEPVQSLDLDLADILPEPGSGQLVVRYPAELHFVPAQVRITGDPDLGPVWLADAVDEKHAVAGRWLGVVPRLERSSFSGVQQTASVFLTNTGNSTLVGELVVEAGGARKAFPWELGPKEVERRRLPASATQLLRDHEAFRLSVDAEGSSEDLLVMVTSRVEKAPPVPIKLSRLTAQQPQDEPLGPQELAAFFWGMRSSLAITNPHPSPLDIQLNVHSAGDETQPYDLRLAAGESKVLNLQESFSISWREEGVLRLTYPAGKPPIGQVLNFDEQVLVSALKDPELDGHLAYSFPVRLGPGLNTRLKVFNPHPESMDLLVMLHFEEDQYLYPLGSLEPRGFAVADLKAQQLAGLEDALGRVIPLDANTGQAFVVSSSTESGRRFLALGSREDSFTGLASASESCAICPPDALDADIPNPPVRGFVPTTKDVPLFVLFSNGFGGLMTPDLVTVDNILVAEGGTSSVKFLTGGTANVTAEIELCVAHTTIPLPDGKSGCTCAFTSVLFDTEDLVSQNITVQNADLPSNEIAVKLEPGGVSGTLMLRAVGSGTSHVILQETKGGGNHTVSFGRTNIAEGDYDFIEGTWTVSPDSGVDQLSYKFSVLPEHTNTCYNTPLETDFGGGLTTVGTTTGPSACTWSTEDFRTSFLDEVNENGSGRDRFGRDMQIESFCTNAPTTSPCHTARGVACARYRVPTQIRTACGDSPTVNHTVAVNASHPELDSGSKIYIEGLGIRSVEDHGALQGDQIDNYQGVGITCNAWANQFRKVYVVP